MLPDFLTRTKEQKEAERARQDELRRKFNSKLRLTPAENERARALVMEKEIRARRKTKERDAQLADNLAKQGRFDEAAEAHPDLEMKDYYRSVWEAVWSDDEDLCDCRQPKAIHQGKQVLLQKFQHVRDIYSLRENQEVPLLRCLVCGDMNARPLTTDLQRIYNAKSDNEALR